MSVESLAPLIELAHHRWNIAVLAELHRRSGAKFVTLVNTLAVSRASLATSLNHLAMLGLVAKNPGYGHPLRPEYVLTSTGQRVGEHCLALTHFLKRRNDTDLAYRKWTLPLVAAIGEEARRFREVRHALDGATPRAITLGLKSLLGQRWVARNLIDNYPPTAGYTLLPKGRAVFNLVARLY